MLHDHGARGPVIHWNPEFCELLGEHGFRVIRFDNRDAGRSTKFDASKPPSAWQLLRRDPQALAYTLDDMADDVIGLLDALELDSAHLVGASMGGMIAQVAAYRHPDRVRSLGLIMTNSGNRIAALPRMRAMRTMLAKPARDRESFVDTVTRRSGSSARPTTRWTPSARRSSASPRPWLGPRPRARPASPASCTRSPPRATGPQAQEGARTHGRHPRQRGPVVRPMAGRSLARAIPTAKLKVIPGMGHDLPPRSSRRSPGSWPRTRRGNRPATRRRRR